MSKETKKYSRTEILLRALLIPNRDGLLLSALVKEFKATEGLLLYLATIYDTKYTFIYNIHFYPHAINFKE